MAVSKSNRKLPGVDFWASLGMLLAGLFFTAYGARAIYLNSIAKNWPAVSGKVLESGMNYLPDVPSFEAAYEYSVDGRRYEGRTDGLSDELVDGHPRYRAGAALLVHYNPANPRVSMVDPSFHFSHLGWMLAGLALVAAGTWEAWNELFGTMGLWPRRGGWLCKLRRRA